MNTKVDLYLGGTETRERIDKVGANTKVAIVCVPRLCLFGTRFETLNILENPDSHCTTR